MRLRKVDHDAATAPSMPKPECPGTSHRLSARLTTFDAHITTAPGTARPWASSQKMPASPTRIGISDRLSMTSTGDAPAARSAETPLCCSSHGPAPASSSAAAMPISSE